MRAGGGHDPPPASWRHRIRREPLDVRAPKDPVEVMAALLVAALVILSVASVLLRVLGSARAPWPAPF
jgi:hypothetical protein